MSKIKNVKMFNKATKIILPAVVSTGIVGSISTVFGNTPFVANEYEEFKLHSLDIQQIEYVNPNESNLCQRKIRLYDANNDNVSKELINALLNDDFEWINDYNQYSEEVEQMYIDYAGNIDPEDYVKAYIKVKENIITKKQNSDDIAKEVALYYITDEKAKTRELTK